MNLRFCWRKSVDSGIQTGFRVIIRGDTGISRRRRRRRRRRPNTFI